MQNLNIEIPKYRVNISKREMLNPDYLRMRRILSGVSVTNIAKKFKVSKQFISKIEKGKAKCPAYIFKYYEQLPLTSGIAF